MRTVDEVEAEIAAQLAVPTSAGVASRLAALVWVLHSDYSWQDATVEARTMLVEYLHEHSDVPAALDWGTS